MPEPDAAQYLSFTSALLPRQRRSVSECALSPRARIQPDAAQYLSFPSALLLRQRRSVSECALSPRARSSRTQLISFVSVNLAAASTQERSECVLSPGSASTVFLPRPRGREAGTLCRLWRYSPEHVQIFPLPQRSSVHLVLQSWQLILAVWTGEGLFSGGVI